MFAKKTAQSWIDELGLKPHPEGGWFRRNFESEQMIDGMRPVMTSIYYLLESKDFSAFHRLKQDEQWHFYAGEPVSIHEIDSTGTHSTLTLGNEGPFQHTVRAGRLFGAIVESGFSLVGCTVAPGFSYTDFEMPNREDLLAEYPEHTAIIRRLTR